MQKKHQQGERQQQAAVSIPDALASLAKGRDFISTAEFAHTFNITPQTVRKNLCLTGVCYGIRPVKFGSRLLWPVGEMAVRLTGGKK